MMSNDYNDYLVTIELFGCRTGEPNDATAQPADAAPATATATKETNQILPHLNQFFFIAGKGRVKQIF